MTLDSLHFDNAWSRLPEDFFTSVTPTPWRGTRLLDISPLGAAQLGLEAGQIERERLEAVMAGRELLTGMAPIAQKYTGHQFGSYNPALGDGRGLLLGDYRTGPESRGRLATALEAAPDDEPLQRFRARLAAPFAVHDDDREDWFSPPPGECATGLPVLLVVVACVCAVAGTAQVSCSTYAV